MNLEIEFQMLKEGQEKILQMLSGKPDQVPKTNVVYTNNDLAKMFKVTPRCIYNWEKRGMLSSIQIGSKTYVSSSHLEDFLQQNEVKSLKMRRRAQL